MASGARRMRRSASRPIDPPASQAGQQPYQVARKEAASADFRARENLSGTWIPHSPAARRQGAPVKRYWSPGL